MSPIGPVTAESKKKLKRKSIKLDDKASQNSNDQLKADLVQNPLQFNQMS